MIADYAIQVYQMSAVLLAVVGVVMWFDLREPEDKK